LGKTEEKRLRDLPALSEEKPQKSPQESLRYLCSNFVTITGFSLIFYGEIFFNWIRILPEVFIKKTSPPCPMPNSPLGTVDAADFVLEIIKHQLRSWTALISHRSKWQHVLLCE